MEACFHFATVVVEKAIAGGAKLKVYLEGHGWDFSVVSRTARAMYEQIPMFEEPGPGNGNDRIGDLYDQEQPAYLDDLDTIRRLRTRIEAGDEMSARDRELLSASCYSTNEHVQREVAAAYASMQNSDCVADRNLVEQIDRLASAEDVEILRSMSGFLGTLASRNENKEKLVRLGVMKPLLKLLGSDDPVVQSNACGCLANLATTEYTKEVISKSGAVPILLGLYHSSSVRVVRNAAGAMLNLTHLESSRAILVKQGALATLCPMLTYPDSDVRYFAISSLSNLAIDETTRTILSNPENNRALRILIQLVSNENVHLQQHACLALRNLAGSDTLQKIIANLGGLDALLELMTSENEAVLAAALAAVRNISVHGENEALIISLGYVPHLSRLLHSENAEIQCHCAGIFRNIGSTVDKKRYLAENGALDALCDVISANITSPAVQAEATAAIAILVLDGHVAEHFMQCLNGEAFATLINLWQSPNIEVKYNVAAALGNLAQSPSTHAHFGEHSKEVSNICIKAFRGKQKTLVQMTLWILLHLSKSSPDVSRGLLAIPDVHKELQAMKEDGNDDVRGFAEEIIANSNG
eukprot:Clim_evm54s172 gene=Clim_evmTU54s172